MSLRFEAYPAPDPLPELARGAAGRRETGIGDVLEGPVPVGGMVAGADERGPDGIQKERGDARIVEEGIDQPEERMTFVLGIGVNRGVAIGARRIAGQTAAALSVLDDDDLSLESLGMLEDPLDEAPDEVRIGASPVLPLGVHLDEDDVVGGDKAVGPVGAPGEGGPVELEAVPAHQIDERVHAGVPVPRRKGVFWDARDPEQRIPGIGRLFRRVRRLTAGKRQGGRSGHGQPDEISSFHDLTSSILRGAVNNLHNPRCSPSTSRAIEKSKDSNFLPGIVLVGPAPF
jgi:hypothetical protein